MRIHLFAIVAVVALWLPTRGEAQFRYGYGLGIGYLYGGFNYRPNQVSYLNQRALASAARATMGPVARNPYANDPNAYFLHLHDPGYLEGYDIGVRRKIEARIGRFSDGPPPSRTSRSRPPLPDNPRKGAEAPTVVRVWPEVPGARPRRPDPQVHPTVDSVVRPSPQSELATGERPEDQQAKAGRAK